MPSPIGMAETVVDFQALCLPLEMSGERRTVVRHIIRMDPIDPMLPSREFFARQRDKLMETRRIVHLARR